MGERDDGDDDEGSVSEVRLVCPMSAKMADDIDRYWHTCRLRSKSEAMRRLIAAGLAVEAAKMRGKRQ